MRKEGFKRHKKLIQAGAASLVLVGSAAGVNYLKNQGDATPISLSSPTPDIAQSRRLEPSLLKAYSPATLTESIERVNDNPVRIVHGNEKKTASDLGLSEDDIKRGRKVKADVMNIATTYIGARYRDSGLETWGGVHDDPDLYFAEELKKDWAFTQETQKVKGNNGNIFFTQTFYGGKTHETVLRGEESKIIPLRQYFEVTLEYTPSGEISSIQVGVRRFGTGAGHIDGQAMDRPDLFEGYKVKPDQLSTVTHTLFTLQPKGDLGHWTQREREYFLAMDPTVRHDQMEEVFFIDAKTNWPATAGAAADGCGVLKINNPITKGSSAPLLGIRPC